jgi:hypothetical protein
MGAAKVARVMGMLPVSKNSSQGGFLLDEAGNRQRKDIVKKSRLNFHPKSTLHID